MELTTYRASDRRVYNGAPCSDMSREMNHTKALEARLKEADPTASCVYFPMQGKYLTFTYPEGKPPQQVSSNFIGDKQEALIEAINLLEESNL